jgi:hypothetical protein
MLLYMVGPYPDRLGRLFPVFVRFKLAYKGLEIPWEESEKN